MEKLKKLKIQNIVALVTIIIGTLLMVGKIYADSEPGAIPLMLIVIGTGWYFISRAKVQSNPN